MDFIFDPSLVLYLPLYKLDGASFMSKDKHGHLCTVTGALWRPNGHCFDGTDDNIDCGSATSLDDVNPKTVIAWIYPEGWGENNKGYVIAKSGFWNFFLLNSASEESLSWWRGHATTNGDWRIPTSSISLNTWQHLALTYDDSNNANDPAIYINAVSQTITEITTPSGAATSDAAETIYVGNASNGDRTWDGLVGELLFYNRALSPLEILHNYLTTKGRYR